MKMHSYSISLFLLTLQLQHLQPFHLQRAKFKFTKIVFLNGLRQNIYDRLYDERTGLPASKYDEMTLQLKADTLFQFFERTQGHIASFGLQ